MTLSKALKALRRSMLLDQTVLLSKVLSMLVIEDRGKYAYCPVNVSRAVGPRCVDRAINNLSNDLEI